MRIFDVVLRQALDRIACCVAAGAVLWRSSEMERRLAAAERDLATLRYAATRPTAAAQRRRPARRLMPGAGRSTADAENARDHRQLLAGRRTTVGG